MMDHSLNTKHGPFPPDRPPQGRRLGLVLGGGGVRGLAHIGVLKVLARQGIRVEILAGTSMGGLVAALFASGWSPDDLEREALRMAHPGQLVKLLDLAPQRRGLLEGSRVRAYLASFLGEECTFADLAVPLALSATDLSTGRVVALQQGPLLEAVLATCAVPGLFPPVLRDGHSLVDGGLLDNLPTGMARSLGAQVILAVDVSPDLASGEGVEDEPARKGWPRLFPPFVRDFYQAEMIMISTLTRIRMEQSPPDLLLRPAVPPSVSIFWGFNHIPQAIAAGEQAAQEALPEILQILSGT